VQKISIERGRQFNSGDRPTGKLEWPAWLRKLDRLDTSYRN